MPAKPVQIGKLSVGHGCPPVIVAEISGNHNGSLERALHIVDAIAKTGAHAVKLQTYTAATMTLPLTEREFFVSDPKNPWTGQSLYDLYEQAHTPWEWHRALFDRCRDHGLLAFSTPFDFTAVDFLEELQAPCYKIASFENIDLPLIRRVAATGKPVIISTGMASAVEIAEAVAAARDAGCRELILLKCTSTYPAAPHNSHLRTIPHLGELFQCPVGLSDHTLGIGAAVAAVALGASIIEKHITLDRRDGGVDASFSLEPDEMSRLVSETHRAWESLGSVQYGPTEDEKASLQYRRSLYVVKDVRLGEILTESNVRAIRPGLGLAPKHIDVILGRKAGSDIARGTPLTWGLVA
ncbi:MAG: pseudaminic acid synthase [Chthoniobacterales bacterium]